MRKLLKHIYFPTPLTKVKEEKQPTIELLGESSGTLHIPLGKCFQQLGSHMHLLLVNIRVGELQREHTYNVLYTPDSVDGHYCNAISSDTWISKYILNEASAQPLVTLHCQREAGSEVNGNQ